MLFNSIEFLIYLPIVFVLYWYVFQRNLRLQNLFVVIVSYVFYGWWDWRFLFLIAFTTYCSYLSGLWIDRSRAKGKGKKQIKAIAAAYGASVIDFYNCGINYTNLSLFTVDGIHPTWIGAGVLGQYATQAVLSSVGA